MPAVQWQSTERCLTSPSLACASRYKHDTACVATQNKITKFFSEHNINTVELLFNNAFLCEDILLCGTRGWYNDTASMPLPGDYAKICARECGRLERSIEYAKTLACTSSFPLVAFLHFPPVWKDFIFEQLVELLIKNDVKKCYYGHIHGVYNIPAVTEYKGIEFELISADYLDFVPRRIFLR